MKKYGHIIASLRKKAGLTQDQLGQKLNVTYQAVSKWENNLSEPDLETIDKITQIFGITVAQFFDMEQNPNLNIKEQKNIPKQQVTGLDFISKKPWWLIAGLGILIFILSLCVFFIPKQQSGDNIFKNISPSTFSINTYKEYDHLYRSTGFFINSTGLAVTTFDIIDGATRGNINLDGKTYSIESVVGVDKEQDIALIQIDITHSKPVVIGSAGTELAQKVYTVGYNQNCQAILNESLISKISHENNHKYWQLLTTSCQDGNALVNQYGQVVGMITSSFYSDTGMDSAVSLTSINKIKQDINVSLEEYERIYTECYYVSFDANGGQGNMADQKIKINRATKLNAVEFTHPSKMFVGWQYNSVTYNDCQEVYNLASKDTHITLQAVWAEYYTIVFDANGATSGIMENQRVPINTHTNINKCTYEKEYQYLGHWVYNGQLFDDQDTIYNLAGAGQTITLKAIWAYYQYLISYELYGGKNGDNETYYDYNSKDIILENATKTGYNFNGWYTNENFTGEKVTCIPSGSSGDIKLYASFSVIIYNINYHLDEDESTTNPTTYTINDISISLTAPVKNIEGFEFIGWYLGQGYRFNTEKVTEIDCCTLKNYDLYAMFVSRIDIDGYRALYSKDDMYYYFQSGEFEYKNQNFILCNDIQMLGDAWEGIEYSGHFNGNGYAIKVVNLINKEISNIQSIGFFSELNNAKVENLTLIRPEFYTELNIKQQDTTMSAFLCTKAINSTISNCKILDGRIRPLYANENFYFGSLVGYAENCIIDKCYSNSALSNRDEYYGIALENNYYVGGLIGFISGTSQNYSLVSNSYCEGDQYLRGNYESDTNIHFSSFVGVAKYCNISNSYSTSLHCLLNVNKDSDLIIVGGIVAKGENCNISNSFATGDFRIGNQNYTSYQNGYSLVGTLCGHSTLQNCYSLTKLLDIDKDNATVLTDCVADATTQQIYEKIKKLWDNEIWTFPENLPPVLKEE